MNNTPKRQSKARVVAIADVADVEIPGFLVVTSCMVSQHRYRALSRFGDDIWRLPESLFPHGVADSYKRLRFDNIPADFRYVAKASTLRFFIHGREGSRRPRGGTLYNFLKHTRTFYLFLSERQIVTLNDVTQIDISQYVDLSHKEKSRVGKPISKRFLENRFSALEQLHEFTQYLQEKLIRPWPESTSRIVSRRQVNNRNKATTPIIPDPILSLLFSAAVEELRRASKTFAVRFAADFIARQYGNCATSTHAEQIARTLRKNKFATNLKELNALERRLFQSCIVILLTTSGLRVHELASLENSCCYSTLSSDGDHYFWIKGVSEKTSEGATEWMVPEIASEAIRALEQLKKPQQKELLANYRKLRKASPDSRNAVRLKSSLNKLILGKKNLGLMSIKVLSQARILELVNEFSSSLDVDWHFTPHQFRRTYAVYAARSAFGDLRYLKEHFKHWTLDMSMLYALNESQEADLYDQVMYAVIDEKTSVVEHWLQDDMLITGGAAGHIASFRSGNQAVKTYSDRRELAEQISDQVHIRATTVGWCIADDGGCNGGNELEVTRCAGCGNAVIDSTKRAVWEEIYNQQCELRELNDIGPGGQARISRDIGRCRSVLSDLVLHGETSKPE